MTTERIDVLAVMRDASNAIAIARYAEGLNSGIAAELNQARAAIAELIEAVETVERIDRGLWAESGRADAMRVLYAALARVGAP